MTLRRKALHSPESCLGRRRLHTASAESRLFDRSALNTAAWEATTSSAKMPTAMGHRLLPGFANPEKYPVPSAKSRAASDARGMIFAREHAGFGLISSF